MYMYLRKSFLALLLLAGTLAASAQQNTELRRSKDIFEFPEFQLAKVQQPFSRFVKDSVNIFLKDASLCYLRKGKVYKADLTHILGVQFDSVAYRKVNDRMGRIVQTQGPNSLVCVTTVNMKQYKSETHGGENMPYFEIAPDAGSNLFIDLDRGEQRDEDLGLPLMNTYYFVIKGEVVPATETKIKKFVRSDMKMAFKNLMADRFWSWKDEHDLSTLLMYF